MNKWLAQLSILIAMLRIKAILWFHEIAQTNLGYPSLQLVGLLREQKEISVLSQDLIHLFLVDPFSASLA